MASPLTVAILVGMSVSDVSQKAVANLGWKDITLPNPVFHGDTLYGESEVIEKRESASRPNKVSFRSKPSDATSIAISSANSTALC